MKLSELLTIVNNSYPDGGTAPYWEKDPRAPLGSEADARVLGTGCSGGDTLAEFLVREIVETFVPGRPDVKQLGSVYLKIDNARGDLFEVAWAINTEKRRVRKGARDVKRSG